MGGPLCTIRLGAFDSTADWWWWWAWSRGQWSRWVASDKPDVADTAQPSTSRDAPHTAKAEPATRSRWVRRGGRAAAAGPPTRPSRLDEAASKGRLRSRQSPSSEPGSPRSLSRLRCPTRPAQLMGGGTGTEGRNSPPQPSHITCQRGRPLPLSPSAASLPSPSSCWPPISQWRCRCSASLLVLVQALTPLRRQGCGQRRTTSTYSSSSSRLSPPLPSFAPSPSLFEACE